MSPKYSVFTPTYNRAYCLKDLYDSLVLQKYKDFEWLIVDDGSEDETENIVQGFMHENLLNIRYLKKSNEGKHIAINYGAKVAQGMWFFIVDSDDKLTPDALQIVDQYCNQISDDQSFAGVAGLRGYDTSTVIMGTKGEKIKVSEFKEDYFDATTIYVHFSMNNKADHAEVIRTCILKEYPFPKFENEKFLSEGALWFRLSNDGYKLRWFNKIIYITEYHEDGLTKNAKKNSYINCHGKSYINNLTTICKGVPLIWKLQCSIRYFAYGAAARISVDKLWKKRGMKIASFFTLPLGGVYYLFKIRKFI